MTFVNFLLEKDFVHPLSPEQLEELRQRHIQVISCSTCGAPVDLSADRRARIAARPCRWWTSLGWGRASAKGYELSS